MLNLDNLKNAILNSEKTLYILCGFPYGGKSYVASKISSEIDIIYVSIDQIFESHGFDWDSNMLPSLLEWEEIFQESYEKVYQGLSNGKNVLYDSTNHTVVSRDKLREVAKLAGGKTVVVYIETTDAVVWARWKENFQKRSRSVVDKELVKQTIESFERPTEDENLIIINNK